MTTHSATRLGACCMILAGGLFSAPPPAHAGSEKIIYAFKGGLDGNSPDYGLTKLGDRFYGVTFLGGTSGYGTIFYVKLDGTHKILHSFDNGEIPFSGLAYFNGRFYGTTLRSPANLVGSIYAISPGGAFSTVHRFGAVSDGAYPAGTPVIVGNTLYGVTLSGGIGDKGTVFTLDAQGVENTFHNFADDPSRAGETPNPLMTDGTTLYGTTIYGGGGNCYRDYGCGTVYSLTTKGILTQLYASFRLSDFESPNPNGRLLKIGDELYGATKYISTRVRHPYESMLFKVSLTGVRHILHLFHDDQTNGLIKVGKSFYGLTRQTIYSVTHDVFSTIYNFQPNEGFGSSDELLLVKGSLYGETGGFTDSGPYGAVFSYTP